MSGICGVLRLDGKPAEAEEIAGCLSRLERRGPEGTNASTAGPCVLGHTLLATTPEAKGETLPLCHSETGCLITGDIRLDNRADLIRNLHPEGINQPIGDGCLVLHAYLKWGTKCCEHIRGDFVFAIWDPREGHLFCARDQVGMRQVCYYHAPDRLFCFATEPRDLLQHSEIEAHLNEARVGDFLERLISIDLTLTFWRGVKRLPPAHAMIVRADGLSIWKYWGLEPRAKLTLGSDAEYAEAFREVFMKAVERRLRSNGAVGSMLSGGMDSSSIVATAAHLLAQEGRPPLRTFSAILNNPDCVESNAVKAALSIEHLNPTCIDPDSFEEIRTEVAQGAIDSEEPFDIPLLLVRAMHVSARLAGVNVVLDGGSGDTTLGADDMVLWHMKKGRVLRAWKEAKGHERFWGPQPPAIENFLKRAYRTLEPPQLREFRRNRSVKPDGFLDQDTTLDPEFAKRIDLSARRKRYLSGNFLRRALKDDNRAVSMLMPYVTTGREVYDRIAGSHGVEARDPFVDLELLEFCMSLPAEQFQDAGWPKVILRRAMKGLLPDAVRWRLGKEHIGRTFVDLIWKARLQDFPASRSHLTNQYVASDVLESAQADAKISANWEGNEERAVDQALYFDYLATWINQNQRIRISPEVT